MAIAYEGNTDLAFETDILKKGAKEYGEVAKELRDMADKLDKLLVDLAAEGWSTPAGTAFHDMTSINWKNNIEKYAALLDTLNNILVRAAAEYDGLMADHVRTTQLKL